MAETASKDLESFVLLGKKDRKPGAPRLTWKFEASHELTLTMPYPIMSTIRRARDDDNKARSCIFYWSNYVKTFTDQGFILVHHKDDGSLERVHVDNTTGLLTLPEEKLDSLVITGPYQANLHELAPGEETKTARLDMPERFYRALEAGETYSLVFPGAEVSMWSWGGIQDNVGLEMKAGTPLPSGYRSRPRAKKGEGQARLVMPGAAHVTFTVRVGEPAWPERAEREAKVGFSMANHEEQQWRLALKRAETRRREGSPAPLGLSDGVPGAPIFSVSLKCPPTLRGRENFKVEVSFRYDGVLGEDGQPVSNAQPVTFHWLSLIDAYGPQEGFRLYRRRRDAAKIDESDKTGGWDECELEETSSCYMIVDAPDIEVRVGQHKHFASLNPGETWSTFQTLSGDCTDMPEDMAPGDMFRYGFKGAVVDWWDWGTMEDHAETVVKLPCFVAGDVTEPPDNGGRPKMVVVGAESVEFTAVE